MCVGYVDGYVVDSAFKQVNFEYYHNITGDPNTCQQTSCQSISSSYRPSKLPCYMCMSHLTQFILQDADDDDLDDDTDTLLPPGEVRTGADVEAGEEARAEGLKPADIDAYWLQRNVNKAYSNTLDENEAVKKAEEVFNALQVSGSRPGREGCCRMRLVGPPARGCKRGVQ